MSALGAAVGGMVALLLKRLCVGIALGVVLALYILLLDNGRWIGCVPGPDVASSLIFLATLTLGNIASFKSEKMADLLLFPLFGALLVALGVDIVRGNTIAFAIDSIFQMTWPSSSTKDDSIQWIMLGALGASLIGFLVQAIFCGVAKDLKILFSGYQQIQDTSPVPHTGAKQKTMEYPVDQEFNFFDPAALPPQVSEYSRVVLEAADELGNFFGFQDDSVRNQTEHMLFLLANHKRFTKVSASGIRKSPASIFPHALDLPPTAVHSLHTKMFENYRAWCKKIGVPTRFLTNPIPNNRNENLSDLSLDILLYLFIWGESGNLRHMPEVLCFLYHKMMQEFQTHRLPNVSALYPGFFLDHVVTPIYDEVVKASRSKSDHVFRRNYDDFNEFFWSPDCLRYAYRDIDNDESIANNQNKKVTSISKALATSSKTFLEKRSLIGFILAFSRLFEFFLISFQFQACFAFGQYLVWPLPYYLQIMSTPFLTINILAILRVICEVWMSFPGLKLNLTAVAGMLLRLVFRYVLLTYQCVYLMWSLDKNCSDGTGPCSSELQASKPYMYWWWQYLYISMFVVVMYAMEATLQVFPKLSTLMHEFNNDYFQSFLNIIIPGSRNYTGKSMHDTQANAFWYFFFWGTLIAWKLYFSYLFEVQSCILPSILYFDDYMNLPGQTLVYTMVMIVMKWIPMMLVYVIDGSIWFSVWMAAIGIWVGFQQKLGEVTGMASLRSHFMRAPEAFCGKIINEEAFDQSFSSGVNLIVDERSNLVPKPFSTAPRSALMNIGESQAQSLLKEGSKVSNVLKAKVTEYLDVRTSRWATFGTAWNEVINHLRDSDIISNQERNMLKFHSFHGFARPVYLPVFQTAGFVERAAAIFQSQVTQYEDLNPVSDEAKRQALIENLPSLFSKDTTMKESVSEAWELSSWLLVETMGEAHKADLESILKTIEHWFQVGALLKNMRCGRFGSLLNTLSELVTIMNFQLPRRKPLTKQMTPPSQPAEMKRNFSSGTLNQVKNVPDKVDLVENVPSRYRELKPRLSQHEEFRDKTRDMLREKFRAFLNTIKEMINVGVAGEQGNEVTDRISFLSSHGFFWNDFYASNRLDELAENPLILAVTRKLFGLLNVTPSESEPTSPECHRRLTFFVNSLFMDIPEAPPLDDMFSWTVMTPFYSEDVLLNRGDLEVRNQEGLTTLTYLQALYRNDWQNFLERNKIADEATIYSKKHLQETRLWASIRAQTLARTCEGMMYYEKALRLLGTLENKKVDKIEDLIKQKFGYVITCQIYGKMKRNQDPKADDIDFLLYRYPNLRVAYIDELRLSREGHTDFYSVLIKGDMGVSKEIYRVKLPGNPVVGEGKPENQNHAVIFSRGEYIQAIDMNQDNYFEEALKMRNMLEEFKTSTKNVPITLLGFREHIFTGSVSSLANYMALQELSFVTLGQRVLNDPLRLRLHYGHPDVFDKLFFMTRGGISKASRGINLSEDIFAGYNNQLRGGNVQYKEYMHVGKGRDVGMQQIYKFEAKLSQGAAEQSISRDVHRMCNRLDFCRLMTYYFGALGFYINSFLTVFTITFVVYLSTYAALFGFEAIGDRRPIPEGTLQLFLGGMGILQTIPMFSTIAVENGVSAAFGQVLQVFVSGGPLYFMFHIQTKAHYFCQTLLAGNAQYRPTGRGFVTRHSPYDENFRFFASSHFYLGFELVVALIIMGAYTQAKQYAGRTWSLWLASVSFILAPFWFNPASLEWHKVVDDYKKFIVWMTGTGGTAQKSWQIWFQEEMMFYKQVSPIQKIVLVPRVLLYYGMGCGIIGPRFFVGSTMDYLHVIGGTTAFLAIILAYQLVTTCMTSCPSARRMFQAVLWLSFVFGLIGVEACHPSYIKYTIAAYYFGAAVTTACSIVGIFLSTPYFIHDLLISHCVFFMLFVASGLQVPGRVQSWLLFNNALSRGVAVDDILKFASKARTKDDDEMEPHELRKRLQHTEEMLNAILNNSKSLGDLGSLKSKIERTDSESFLPLTKQDEKPQTKSSSAGLARSRNLSYAKLNALGGPSMLEVPPTQNYDFQSPDAFPSRGI